MGGRGGGGGRGTGGGGRGGGSGRLGGTRRGAGPGGNCVCPNCGYKAVHQVGKPCFGMKCAKCGNTMVRG